MTRKPSTSESKPAAPAGTAKAGAKAPARPKSTARPTAAAGRKAPARSTATTKPAATKPAATKPAAPPKPKAVATATAPLTLLFIRHADAGDSAAWVGNDADRPLSKKGRKQAKRLGSLLDRLGVRPDVLLASPRLRAADTATLVGRRVGRSSKIEARLDAGFDAAALESLVADLDPTASMLAIVGHDPDFSEVASWLVDAPISLAKGALVRIDLPARAIGPGKGTLQWLLPPDAVPI